VCAIIHHHGCLYTTVYDRTPRCTTVRIGVQWYIKVYNGRPTCIPCSITHILYIKHVFICVYYRTPWCMIVHSYLIIYLYIILHFRLYKKFIPHIPHTAHTPHTPHTFNTLSSTLSNPFLTLLHVCTVVHLGVRSYVKVYCVLSSIFCILNMYLCGCIIIHHYVQWYALVYSHLPRGISCYIIYILYIRHIFMCVPL
jgi:hypothetical protein